MESLYNARIDWRYRLSKYIYDYATITVKKDEDLKTDKITVEKRIRPGDT